jgi:anti-anti-sigma regulatory factor
MDCDVALVGRADFATVNALARAAANARRTGSELRVVNASSELRELIGLAGLADVLLGRRGRETEQREEPVGVEERVEPDDPAA